MIPLSRKKIVLLGMMSKMPVGGVVWQTLHYLVGLERLGYDVYYVEAHGCTPKVFFERADDDGWSKAAAFISTVMARFDIPDRWALHALHQGGRCYGLTASQLADVYRSADLIINYHGGTIPRPEHVASGNLIYVETDPVEVQLQLSQNQTGVADFLAQHRAFFTFGESYGQPDCKLPISKKFQFVPTRQPVVLDFWRPHAKDAGRMFTTIGNWRQVFREVHFDGDVYHWSKHYEFLKFLDLPARTGQEFELALSSYDEPDKQLLESKGWKLRPAGEFSDDFDRYRSYVAGSRAEFTVAKDQNIRFRTGWFSDRSATYLAAGRPVITQETGFSRILPTGTGLFAFSTIEEIIEAVQQINSDYETHCQAAFDIAREYFSHDVVLKRLLADAGL